MQNRSLSLLGKLLGNFFKEEITRVPPGVEMAGLEIVS